MPTENVSSPLVAHHHNLWLIHTPSYHAAIIRLQQGGLVLWGAPPFTQALATSIAMLGELQHVIVGSSDFIGAAHAWQKAFPNCQFWASPGVRSAAQKQGKQIAFSNDLWASPDPTWSSELDQLLLKNDPCEAIFYHYESKTLLVEGFVTQPQGLLSRWLKGSHNGVLEVAKKHRSNRTNQENSRRALEYFRLLAPEYLIGRSIGLTDQVEQLLNLQKDQ
ncbi:DUF4336 domain-containing protein [Salinibius halmophilus]|uniref:hypothetical protein n=1 Tax=Salinibius halmophilus TaxID=1853216 RepID=UPI000E66DE90|nr:hypothetical protein [Salinibius halmophilus]